MTLDMQKVAIEFLAQQDAWNSLPEVYDDKLDSDIHAMYVNPPKNFPKWGTKYFTPSSSGVSALEMWLKMSGYKRDSFGQQPHQKRWTTIGTAVGDALQRAILFQERHYESKVGEKPRFVFDRNENGQPLFEEFSAKPVEVSYKDEIVTLFGMCDGIMIYTDDDGKEWRIGLEIKSKSTTPARTSHYSLQEPDDKHVKQTVCYSMMYDVDYFLVVYWNVAKKSWFMDAETYEKNPDLRAFGYEIDGYDRQQVLERFYSVIKAYKSGDKPEFDVDSWTFNNFKQATIETMTTQEWESTKEYAKSVLKSKQPEYKKRQIAETMSQINALRGGK